MPLKSTKTAGAQVYGSAFLNPIEQMDHVKIDVSTLTTDEVDTNGYIKPNVPLQAAGTLVSGASQTVYGLTIEATQIPGRTSNANLAGDTTDPLIAVCTSALINRDIAEDNLGRAFSANELAALTAGGFKVTST
jgi:hypothetical protein